MRATVRSPSSTLVNLNVGYRYESRDEDGVGDGAGPAQNNVVFVGLSRDFEFPL